MLPWRWLLSTTVPLADTYILARGWSGLDPFAGVFAWHAGMISVNWRHRSRQRRIIRMYKRGMDGGWAHPAQGQGFNVETAGSAECSLLLLILLTLFIIGFGTGKTHVTFVNAIFAKVLFTGDAFDQFIGLNFRPT
jgi:hypothetical protein